MRCLVPVSTTAWAAVDLAIQRDLNRPVPPLGQHAKDVEVVIEACSPPCHAGGGPVVPSSPATALASAPLVPLACLQGVL